MRRGKAECEQRTDVRQVLSSRSRQVHPRGKSRIDFDDVRIERPVRIFRDEHLELQRPVPLERADNGLAQREQRRIADGDAGPAFAFVRQRHLAHRNAADRVAAAIAECADVVLVAVDELLNDHRNAPSRSKRMKRGNSVGLAMNDRRTVIQTLDDKRQFESLNELRQRVRRCDRF